MTTNVRLLDRRELTDAPALLAPEGWDFELPELERLFDLGGAVGALDDGRLVGFLTFLDHAPVRWIGNVVVAAEKRGSGLGARLVEKALDGADVAGLYAVEKAITLYERAGFVGEGEAFALRAEHAKPRRTVTSARPLAADDGPDILALDRAATGMDRTQMLLALAKTFDGTTRVVRERNKLTGFGFAKTSAGLTELGPIVATTPTARDALIDALLAAAPGPYEATTLGANAGALAALEARGFQKRFRTVPMFKGAPPAWRAQQMVCAAGLEKS